MYIAFLNTKIMKILIADDHKLMAAGLAAILKKSKNTKIVNMVYNGLEALSFIKENHVDIAILDIEMPLLNGIDTARIIKSIHAEKLKVLIISMHDSENYIMDAVKAGADGYILKNTPPEEMVYAIMELHKGNTYFDQRVMAKLTRDIGSSKKRINIVVTEKENKVLHLIGRGLKPKEIGTQLNYSKHTIITYKRNLFLKFSVNTIEELIKKAVLEGFIKE